MARPVKNTVDYFPHFTNHKKTIFILEQQYGNDGYAFWFKLLELLGSTEKHFIDCNDKSAWRFLQAKTLLSEEKCIEILNLLVEVGAIDEKLWSEKVIWCQNFVDNISDAYRNRRVEIPAKPSFYNQKLRVVEVSTGEKPHSIVKESIVKESIVTMWNKKMPFRIKNLSNQRKKHLKERIGEKDFMDNFPLLLDKILASPFLLGEKPSRQHPNFRADFDWLIKNNTNYLKILEGKYDDEWE